MALLRMAASSGRRGLRLSPSPVLLRAALPPALSRSLVLTSSRERPILRCKRRKLQRHTRALATSSSPQRESPDANPADTSVLEVQSQAPLLVRTGLVGATTALLTPVFPIIGFNQLVFRFVDPATRYAIHGGTSMLYFSTMVLMPKAFYYAPLLLPFAVGNGIVASGVYLAADVAAGGPQALSQIKLGPIPLVGPAIGAVTAALVPFAYPMAWTLVYPEMASDGFLFMDPEVYSFISDVCYNTIAFPCLLTTGVASGFIIHAALQKLVVGIPGVAWTHLAGSILGATLVALLALYSTSTRAEVLHLSDVDVEDPQYQGWLFPKKAPCYLEGTAELGWVPALDYMTGAIVSEGFGIEAVGEGEYRAISLGGNRSPGLSAAATAQALRDKVQDKRIRCYLSRRNAYFDGLTKSPLSSTERRALVSSVPSAEVALTDAAVLLIAGSVPKKQLEESLTALMPFLAQSELAGRLKTWKPYSKAWSQGGKNSLPVLMKDLNLRCAQLREWYRLEVKGEAQGPFEKAKLREMLGKAGIDVERARRGLVELKWEPGADRALDWGIMSGHANQATVETVALGTGLLAAAGIVAFGLSQTAARQ